MRWVIIGMIITLVQTAIVMFIIRRKSSYMGRVVQMYI